MFILKNLTKYKFSINWSAHPREVLTAINTQQKINKEFIKENGGQIMNKMADMFDRSEYNTMLDYIFQINLRLIDKRVLWEQLAAHFRDKLQQIKLMNLRDLQKLVQMLLWIKYQINQNQNPLFCQYLKNVVRNSYGRDLLKLSAFTIGFCPQMFVQHRVNLEQLILEQSLNKRVNKSFDTLLQYTIIQGIVSQFWSNQLLTKLIQNSQQVTLQRIKKYLTISNMQKQPKITKQEKYKKSATQSKIGLMLTDLGYVFETSMFISGIQVDFFFPNIKTIVQYNGMPHYKINNAQSLQADDRRLNLTRLKPTQYQKWRFKILRKRGFNIIEIPFEEWEQIQGGQKFQKPYLISKIQNCILKFYQSSSNKSQML